jgi:hypothetical protein
LLTITFNLHTAVLPMAIFIFIDIIVGQPVGELLMYPPK